MKVNQEISFPLFLVLWNQVQQMKTPAHHLRIAHWLEDAWIKGQKKLLLMAFRAAGKSTLVGLFAAWLLWAAPDTRILVMAADQALARKMVRNVKRILERHPLTGRLKPDRPDQWAADTFTVNRETELRDPSMLARGIGANITGARAELIIYDDVEVPNTSNTADKRAELRQKLAEAQYILAAGGAQLYVGTPHHYHSIYAEKPREELGEIQPFLSGYKRFILPLLDDCGNSNWPERYSLDDISQLKDSTGPAKFTSQMMLQPVNIIEARLDPTLLHFYAGSLQYMLSRGQPHLSLNDEKIVAQSAWWDPAFGQMDDERKRDGSVMAVALMDNKGLCYVHMLEYLRVKKGTDQDEASQQCKQVAMLCKRYFLKSIAVEINGIGRFLPNILRRELKSLGYVCRVEEVVSKTSKAERILEGFDARLAARALYVHEQVKRTPFITEMQEWQPGISKGRDDGLDAVAGALSLLPIRVQGKMLPSQTNTHFDVF